MLFLWHGSQVCVEVVGYLLEELRDGKNYESFKADMQSANVFIGSLIFIEELADKVQSEFSIHSVLSHLLRWSGNSITPHRYLLLCLNEHCVEPVGI